MKRISEALYQRIFQTVDWLHERAGIRITDCLNTLGINRSRYYLARQKQSTGLFDLKKLQTNIYAITESERNQIIKYALAHSDYRYRELTYRMIDENIVYVSESSVYRVLKALGLMSARPKRRRHYQRPKGEWAQLPDERWQIDIMYVRIILTDYYLLIFLDEYSRYIIYWKLLHFMDGQTVGECARQALTRPGLARIPVIQTDNGSAFISGDFRRLLSGKIADHIRINVGSPAENALVERSNRTIREGIEEQEPGNYEQSLKIIGEVIDYYNHKRYHSSLNFMPPAVYYRGKPESILEERRRKLAKAKELRRLANLGEIQIPLLGEKTLLFQ